MTLENDLKKGEISITKTRDNTIHAEFFFPNDLPVFQGHFPGMPLLPGIFQIEMVRYALEKGTGRKYRVKSIKKTKFTDQILPDCPVTIDITMDMKDKELKVKATLTSNHKPVGKTFMIVSHE